MIQLPQQLIVVAETTLRNQVSNGSPAALAGLQAADRILVLGSLDAEAINRKVDTVLLIIVYSPGTLSIVLELQRSGLLVRGGS